MPSDAIEEAIEALRELDRILDECAGNTEVRRRTREVVLRLADKDDGGGKFGNIRMNVADAISRAYLRQPLDHLRKQGKTPS